MSGRALKIAVFGVYIHLQSYTLRLHFHEPMYKVHKEINLPHKGVSGGGSLEHVKGSPVTKGCFEACMHII